MKFLWKSNFVLNATKVVKINNPYPGSKKLVGFGFRFRIAIPNCKYIFFKVGYNEDADLSSGNLKFYDTPAPMDIMDDFFLIAQETEKRDTQVRKKEIFKKHTYLISYKQGPQLGAQLSKSFKIQNPIKTDDKHNTAFGRLCVRFSAQTAS